MDEKEKAEFEAWAKLSEYEKKGTHHDVVGWYYFDDDVQSQWQAWQAGRQALSADRARYIDAAMKATEAKK